MLRFILIASAASGTDIRNSTKTEWRVSRHQAIQELVKQATPPAGRRPLRPFAVATRHGFDVGLGYELIDVRAPPSNRAQVRLRHAQGAEQPSLDRRARLEIGEPR